MSSKENDVHNGAEHERLLSGSTPIPQVYGSKPPEDQEIATMADSEAKVYNPSNTGTQYIAALAAAGGALAAGTTLGWSSTSEVLVLAKNSTAFSFQITQDEWTWASSIVTIGAAIVCLFIGTIINLLGRKLTMLLLVIPFTVGWALVIWPNSAIVLIIGRFLLGISGGAFCVCAPTYTAEIAQSDIRGSLGSYFQLMLVIGVLFAYVVGSFANVFTFSLICGTLPLIFGAIFVFMPETPVYLVSRGKTEEAAKALQWLRGSHYDYTHELAELKAQDDANKANTTSFAAALQRKSTIKAIIISFGLMLFQQASGINAVIFYTKSIFEAANTGIDSGLAVIVVGIMQVVAVFVSSLVVDKLGRRLLLLPSITTMSICTILLGYYFFQKDKGPEYVEGLGWLPITAMCVFIVLFSLGFGPIPWMMMGELFAPDIKGTFGSLVGTFNWTLAFIITKSFSTLNETFGNGQTFWIFSGFCILGIVFTLLVVPETKGKSLAEIQRMLNGEKALSAESGNATSTVDSKF